jgi:hypothetical protein
VGHRRSTAAASGVLALLVVACAGSAVPTPGLTVPFASPSGGILSPEPSPSPEPTPAPTPTDAPTPSPTPLVDVSPGPCPGPVTVRVLGGWDPAWRSSPRVDCFGSAELRVTGWIAAAEGIGGAATGIVPAWIGEWWGLPRVLYQKPLRRDPDDPLGGFIQDPTTGDGIWLFLFAPDASALPLAPERWVTVTGHFDDPASTTCRWSGELYTEPVSDAAAIAACRSHFVVTAIEDAAAPTP